MDGLEAFAIGWCSSSLLDILRENKQEKGKPYVPNVMRIFELNELSRPVVCNVEVLKKIDPLEASKRIESYKASLRVILDQNIINDEPRVELISFLESVSDYCILASQRPGYF